MVGGRLQCTACQARAKDPPVLACADGRLLAVVLARPAARNVELWDADSLAVLAKIKAADVGVRALCLSGGMLATGEEKGRVRVWRVQRAGRKGGAASGSSKLHLKKPKEICKLRGHCG